MSLVNAGSLSLCLCFLLLSPITVSAQRGAVEINAGGGLSVNSTPTDNMPFKGAKLTANYSTILCGVYNFHRSMSAGIEVRSLGLSRKSDIDLNTMGYTFGAVGGDNRKITYSANMVSVCAVYNAKLNTYRGYFYGGAAIGYGFSAHDDGRINPNTEVYRSPDGGSGVSWGVQAGYTYGISSALGLNFEGALRNYTLNYNSAVYPSLLLAPDLSYNITAYTFTVGLKVRILPKYKAQNDIPAMRGKGRSRRAQY